MTVKALMQQLEKCDPNSQVRVGTCCGTVDGTIKRVFVNVVSPSNKEHCVYLECEMTHYKGEKVRQTYTNERKQSLQLF